MTWTHVSHEHTFHMNACCTWTHFSTWTHASHEHIFQMNACFTWTRVSNKHMFHVDMGSHIWTHVSIEHVSWFMKTSTCFMCEHHEACGRHVMHLTWTLDTANLSIWGPGQASSIDELSPARTWSAKQTRQNQKTKTETNKQQERAAKLPHTYTTVKGHSCQVPCEYTLRRCVLMDLSGDSQDVLKPRFIKPTTCQTWVPSTGTIFQEMCEDVEFRANVIQFVHAVPLVGHMKPEVCGEK